MAESHPFFFRLGRFVARWRWQVVLVWILILVALRLVAPPWDSVTFDGDFAYLPNRSPSVIGESLLTRAFPHDNAKSQLVVIISRPDRSLAEEDVFVSYDVARRMKALHGAAAFQRTKRLQDEAKSLREKGSTAEADATEQRAELSLQEAQQAMDEAIYFDQQLLDFRRNANGSLPSSITPLAPAYWNRALLNEHLGETEKAAIDRQRAITADPDCEKQGPGVLPVASENVPILDVWTWRDPVFGAKLISPNRQARLVVLQIANEFLAVRNQPLLDLVQKELQQVRATMTEEQRKTLSVRVSGSAAVGGDMLQSAKESIDNTELYTVLLIVGILVIVYRAPLLVLIALVSIVVSLIVSTNLVAWLAGLAELPTVEPWWGFKVFTTTKIFIVVMLFGAGTDYCLFLIARYREELANGNNPEEATAKSLLGVGDALAASALTTILGLAMMFFSEFGKFRYSGPVIGLCLTIALLVCLTLTPALLCSCGRYVFWPFKLQASDTLRAPWSESLWRRTADMIVRRPGLILSLSILGMVPLATYGLKSADNVTYDVLAALDESRPSRKGADALRQHFPIGESGPVTLVVFNPDADFRSQDGRKAIYELSRSLYQIDGVSVVRSIVDPLGDFPPGETIGLMDRRAWKTWLSRPHRKTESVFVAQTAELGGKITRMDVILRYDPFSREAVDALRRMDLRLRSLAGEAASFWQNCQFSYAGPTAAVRDLREVTLGDRRRIELLVVLAVYGVLVAILRRPLVCLYLIASVLITYFVTIGLTELFFQFVYGATYQGLDWKVPLFLFVILVAVGQDYNVCLVTRVYEEQDKRGPIAGLRMAVARTGGIITSCGVIMAGTFISMTSVAWEDAVPVSWHWLRQLLHTGGGLRGMVELGFALTLGVLIDTFIVRPILVPAFFALVGRVQVRKKSAAGIMTQP